MLGDYRLLALVGQGQFAQVHAAVHRRTGRLVAIKQTRHAAENPSQEPQVLQRLDHPNIVRAQAVGKTELGYRIVLEYCEGGTLRSHLASTLDLPYPLPLTETKHLIGDILAGLSHIHQRGIIHGDLKPENIFLTYRRPFPISPAPTKTSSPPSTGSRPCFPTLKIGDFGSARFVNNPNHSRREIGSPTYAAPERFDGQSSYASDLYAVGVILYELLLGTRPFSGSPEELKQAHQTQPIPLPDNLTFAARQLLETALHKQPKQRFSSADAMLSTLQNLTSVTTSQPHAPTLLSGLSQATLNQAIAPIPSNGIMAPIEALLSIPQGCCIVTERSLHVLTPKRKLLSIARFTQPCWIAVSPSGKWFSAITKQKINSSSVQKEQNKKDKAKTQTTTKSTRRSSKGMLGHMSEHSGHRWRRALTLTGPLLTTLQAQVLQVIALDERYLLRVSSTASNTYFECFTRRGQFIGEYILHLPLIQVTPTMVPYQLIAMSKPTHNAEPKVVLISLKPFQVRQIHLPITPERVNAFPWGYLVSHKRKGLLLDSSAQMAGLLSGLSLEYATAAIDSRSILLASTHPSSTASATPAKQLPVGKPSSLLVADISELDLGIIF
ncbi:MAG: serine/threonine-protein kinase [Cyanobacteria bacterium J06632_3]